jgi:hypothetical protein
MKLPGPLAARPPGLRLGLRLALALKIERHGGADEILQGLIRHYQCVIPTGEDHRESGGLRSGGTCCFDVFG